MVTLIFNDDGDYKGTTDEEDGIDHEFDGPDNEYTDEGEMKINVAYKILEDISRRASGIGFVLMMKHGTGSDYSFHPRFDQPCQGGELRKYSKTHPDETTQPHNLKPGDLHHPFPSGTPSALAFHIFRGYESDASDLMFRYVVQSDSSPWKKGFGGEGNIIPIITSGHVTGFILRHLDIDPTVMVNGLNFMRNNMSTLSLYELIAGGLEPNEALLAIMMNGVGGNFTYLHQTYDYYFPSKVSVRRFLEGKPNDLTGGTLEQRADYNRTYVQDVFSSKDGLVWWTEMYKTLEKSSGFTIQEYVKAVKQFISKGLELEPEVIEETYVYRNAMGIPQPYPEFAMKINPSLSNVKKDKAA